MPKAYPHNPRTLTKKRASELESSLLKLGDLSGIVHNLNDDSIIGGNQRMFAVFRNEADITLTEQYAAPDEQGTVAHGFVVWRGHKYAYRQVRWDEVTAREANIRANHAAGVWDWNELASWDTTELAEWGFDNERLAEWNMDALNLREMQTAEGAVEDEGAADALMDKAGELQKKWQVKRGDIWAVGKHRVMCGDCTSKEDVARLMQGEKALLVNADPPYGMGKEKDGIANDNLYREKLDAFQMQWWRACRLSLADNGSAYIWGNAEDLWRLWYCGGLRASERLTVRNEIVWDKGGGGFGVGTKSQRSYFPEERCLFFMIGEQGFNNNSDSYWEGWESIRSYMESQIKKTGWGPKDIQRITGVGMFSHWFTKSQFVFITEDHYKKLQAAAKNDAFKRDYDELERDYYATRAYFDNAHDNMTDVWKFSRVSGDERWEHATPKPVAMMARIIKSSAPQNSTVLIPFVGSGSDLVACEQTGRIGRGMEISEKYVAVTLQRLSDLGLEVKRITTAADSKAKTTKRSNKI